MSKTASILLTAFAIVINLLIFPAQIQAASDVSNSTYIFYQIDESSNVRVTFDIELMNITTNKILSSYDLKIPYENITDLNVMENSDDANITSTSKDGYTDLHIALKKEVFGKNASVRLKITFNTKDIRSANDPMNFNISAVKFSEDIRQLNAKITIPKSLGSVNYLSSGQDKIEQNDKEYVINLQREFVEKNIRIELGDYRNYHFTLRYPIKNDDKKSNLYTITLPPKIALQEVYYNYNNSVPDNSFMDRDGNILVQYKLAPGEVKEVVVSGNIRVQNYKYQTDEDKYLDKLLANSTYISKDLELVKQLSKEIDSKKVNSTEKGYIINNEVRRIMSFDPTLYSNTGYSRKKAEQLLGNTAQNLSIDYADLFLSIARAAKIPSRIVVGRLMNASEFGLSEANLHAWVEIYDYDKGWIPFDPALEDVTGFRFAETLSMNHVALAVWGGNDSLPSVIIPLNMSSSSQEDNFQIYLYQEFNRVVDSNAVLNISTSEPTIDNIHDPFDFELKIENNTDQFAYFTNIKVEDYKFDKAILDADRVEIVFPHSVKDLSLKIYPHAYMSMNGEDFVKATIHANADKEYVFDFNEKTNTTFLPIYIASWGFTFLIALIILFALFYRRYVIKKRVMKKYSKFSSNHSILHEPQHVEVR